MIKLRPNASIICNLGFSYGRNRRNLTFLTSEPRVLRGTVFGKISVEVASFESVSISLKISQYEQILDSYTQREFR